MSRKMNKNIPSAKEEVKSIGTRGNNKYHKDNSKGKRARAQFDEAGLSSKGRDNKPGYYFVSPELAEQAAQLSFQDSLGIGDILPHVQIPTICVFRMNPSIGITLRPLTANNHYENFATTDDSKRTLTPHKIDLSSRTDGLNLDATKIYTLLSSFSGRVVQYQPCDVGGMIAELASFTELEEHIRRAFGVAFLYNFRNRTVPKELIHAMGFDADDLFEHMADYRMRFNTIISRINQLPLLGNIAFIDKSRELYQKVYTDAESNMSQLYLMVPDTVWVMDEQTYSSGTQLVTTEWRDPLKGWGYNTMDYTLDVLESIAEGLLNSSTLQIIYADLMHLANKVNVPTWNFDYLAENYAVTPEYNRTFLLQIHNMTIGQRPATFEGLLTNVQGWVTSYDWNDAQYVKDVPMTPNNDVAMDPNTGLLVYNPIGILPDGLGASIDALIDMDTSAPSLEDRIEALRYNISGSGFSLYHKHGSTFYGGSALPALPDHYCVGCYYWKQDVKGENEDMQVFRSFFIGSNPGITVTANIDKFAYHPFVYAIGDYTPAGQTTRSRGDYRVNYLVGDTTYYTTVDYMYMLRLNRLMCEGLFDFRIKGGSTNNTQA